MFRILFILFQLQLILLLIVFLPQLFRKDNQKHNKKILKMKLIFSQVLEFIV